METRLKEFRDVKAHYIVYQIKILLFCGLLLFFQNKARTADSSDNEFIVKVYLCMTTVHIIRFIVR